MPNWFLPYFEPKKIEGKKENTCGSGGGSGSSEAVFFRFRAVPAAPEALKSAIALPDRYLCRSFSHPEVSGYRMKRLVVRKTGRKLSEE